MSGYRITRVVTPAESLALVSVDDAKAALGIDPADTARMRRWLARSTA